jgi:hypothetical protein
MYAKLFMSLYQGTLRGCADEILVFTNLIAYANSNGEVDKHWRAIADETGISVTRVKKAIANLEAPDPESRSPEEDGRRIVPMDEHRAWGWKIVNYAKYRAIRNEDDRREQNRAAQQRYRDKNKTPEIQPERPKRKPPVNRNADSKQVSQGKPDKAQAEAEVEEEVEERGEETAEPSHPLKTIEPNPDPSKTEIVSETERLMGFDLSILAQERVNDVVPVRFKHQWSEFVKDRMLGNQNPDRNYLSKCLGYWLTDFRKDLWRYEKDAAAAGPYSTNGGTTQPKVDFSWCVNGCDPVTGLVAVMVDGKRDGWRKCEHVRREAAA